MLQSVCCHHKIPSEQSYLLLGDLLGHDHLQSSYQFLQSLHTLILQREKRPLRPLKAVLILEVTLSARIFPRNPKLVTCNRFPLDLRVAKLPNGSRSQDAPPPSETLSH